MNVIIILFKETWYIRTYTSLLGIMIEQKVIFWILGDHIGTWWIIGKKEKSIWEIKKKHGTLKNTKVLGTVGNTQVHGGLWWRTA